jgi:hypothetical protein
MVQAETNSPSAATLKRLFALSGNCCAFPKCRTSLVLGHTLVGEVCHIKGAKLGSARYDPDQPPAERHAYDNLILLCAVHHTVIDDDEIAYTVDRLKALKVSHELRASPATDAEQSAFALIIDQSVNVNGQTGGIAAHTVNAETIHLHSAPRSTLGEEKSTLAIEILWRIILSLKAEFSMVTFVDTMLTPEELQEGFRSGSGRQPFAALAEYAQLEAIIQKYRKAGGDTAEAQRPFVTKELYAIFYAMQAVICRSGTLVHLSWVERRHRAWRDDSGIAQLLRSVLSEDLVLSLLALKSYALESVLGALEDKFLQEAERCRERARTI